MENSAPFCFPPPFCNVVVATQLCNNISTLQGERDVHRCFKDFWRGMLEETASVTYSVRCFDFKGFKFMTRISFLAIFTAQIFENCFSISRGKNYTTNFIQNRELNKKTRVWPTLLISNSRPNAVNAELSKT